MKAIECEANKIVGDWPRDLSYRTGIENAAKYRAMVVRGEMFVEKHKDRLPGAYEKAKALAADAGKWTGSGIEVDKLYSAAVAMNELIRALGSPIRSCDGGS